MPRLVALTVIAFALAWLLPGRPVPIYDGVGAPDEPYRFVRAPSGDTVRTRPPTVAKVRLPMVDGSVSDLDLATAEQGPQAEAVFLGTALTVPLLPNRVTPVTATVVLAPLAPDSAVGGGPRIDGNIYRLAWSADGPTVQYTNHGSDSLYLRATTGPPPPSYFIYRRGPNEPWRALPTDRTGVDVYSALIQGPGDYALIREPLAATPASATRTGTNSSVPTSVVIAVVLVVFMLGSVLTVRILRKGRTG
ncbi:MAG: hypothetical protein ACRDVG_01505 [Jatrophihabitantaceae bacterium]